MAHRNRSRGKKNQRTKSSSPENAENEPIKAKSSPSCHKLNREFVPSEFYNDRAATKRQKAQSRANDVNQTGGLPMSAQKPRLSSLAFVGFYVNSAIANGHGAAISFDELYASLEDGRLLEYLDRKIPGEFDFSLFPPGNEQNVALNYVLNEVAGGLRGREDRKLGIKKSGLHLLLAFIIEAMQKQFWINPGKH
jgi:hypothetical protein